MKSDEMECVGEGVGGGGLETRGSGGVTVGGGEKGTFEEGGQ